jgi:hypothetical protein
VGGVPLILRESDSDAIPERSMRTALPKVDLNCCSKNVQTASSVEEEMLFHWVIQKWS